mmetsp:Transcript_11849/g.13664  ORF Transcript_11849/g.13664 Transcript_11849/m.13664 type:complete len:379 (-) Transcript_11849:256-1392(-)
MFPGKKEDAKYERIGEDGQAEQSQQEDVESAVSEESRRLNIPESAEPDADEIEEDDDPNALSLKIKGTDNKTLLVKIANDASVIDLKTKLADLTDFSVERQRLIFLGRMLTDGSTLADYKIKDGNFIHLVPKPAGFVSQPSDSSISSNHLTEESIILPTDLSVFRNDMRFRDNEMGMSSEDYMRRLELGLWRARVRLMSSLCLFYYFLEFMNILAFWMHPDEADQRFEHGHHPSNLYYALDTVENLWGIVVALKGLKTAAEDSTLLSKSFLHDLSKLGVIHFVNLMIWCREVSSGQIKELRQQEVGNKSPDGGNPEDVGMELSFTIMINVMIWVTILAVAAKYHAELVSLHGEEELADEEDEEVEESNNTENRAMTPV